MGRAVPICGRLCLPGYTGSYSSVRRFVRALAATTPRVTSVLEFAPGEAAPVDFGKGPQIVDVQTGEVFKTWVFVMVLAWSWHPPSASAN